MGKLKILYVDDQPFESLIEFMGMYSDTENLFIAKSFSEALEIFNQKEPFNLIICDGNLGGMDTGIDFFKKIKKRQPDKFILFSGDSNLLTKAESLGIETFSKGGIMELCEVIKKMTN